MTQPDLDNITATDLSDDERLSTLYLEAVRRKFWPNNLTAVLEFLVFCCKGAEGRPPRHARQTLLRPHKAQRHTLHHRRHRTGSHVSCEQATTVNSLWREQGGSMIRLLYCQRKPNSRSLAAIRKTLAICRVL